VDVIKVFATDRAGVASSDPRRRLLSDEELIAAVDEAHEAGARVGAHAHGDEGAQPLSAPVLTRSSTEPI
jgi:imidazolonepropionase-like amidohydrolase